MYYPESRPSITFKNPDGVALWPKMTVFTKIMWNRPELDRIAYKREMQGKGERSRARVAKRVSCEIRALRGWWCSRVNCRAPGAGVGAYFPIYRCIPQAHLSPSQTSGSSSTAPGYRCAAPCDWLSLSQNTYTHIALALYASRYMYMPPESCFDSIEKFP